MNRYIIGALALIGLAILLIVLLTTGNHKTTPPPTATKSLVSYADTNAVAKLVVDGPIVAPQNHNSADISISKTSATFDLVQGYNGNVVASKIYNNTENSYSNFLYAIYYAGFTSGTNSITYPVDTGLCPTGVRYDFYFINNGKTLLHHYITDCGASPHTFNGNLNLALTLFEDQIPDISSLTANTNL